jgi:hypothetical protein
MQLMTTHYNFRDFSYNENLREIDEDFFVGLSVANL